MGLFRPQPPEASASRWHVSPAIDVTAYAFSWLWLLVPVVLLGPARADYLIWYLFAIILTDVHRHFGLPYVYMDKSILRQYPMRFLLFTGVLAIGWAASPLLVKARYVVTPLELTAGMIALVLLLLLIRRDGSERAATRDDFLRAVLLPYALAFVVTRGLAWWGPAEVSGWVWIVAGFVAAGMLDLRLARRKLESKGGPLSRMTTPAIMAVVVVGVLVLCDNLGTTKIPFRRVYAAIATFAILWNFWHVYMQKYGIMRLYNAKSGNSAKVPGWVDRALIFAWLPLFFSWLGPIYRDLAARYFSRSRGMLNPLLDFMEAQEWWLVPTSTAFLVAAIVVWLAFEWRVNRLRNAPRLWFATGTTALNACFLGFDPVKVYLAFAFSHAVEYMVFVWAFQRRKYRDPAVARESSLGRVLSRPVLAYVGFTVVVGAAFLLLGYYGNYIVPMPRSERPEVAGIRTAAWLSYWGIYQSIQHFYFDGFLWKMRSSQVRASI